MKKSIVACFAALSANLAMAEPPSFLFYTGSGYVAAGRTDTISSLDGFVFQQNSLPSRNSVTFNINDFASNPSLDDAQWFLLFLTAPASTELRVGTFQNATRAPFQAPGTPGLWFAGNGRGSNEIMGSFTILDIGFDGDDMLSSLAVDFVQYEENGYLGTTYGSLRFRSAIPLTTAIPEPSTYLLLGTGILALGLRRKAVSGANRGLRRRP